MLGDMDVPHIATPRLLLREFRTSDFEAYAENLADPIATEHLSGVTDRRTAWRMFASQMGYWMLRGAGWWGVELQETREMVGTVGAFFRETGPELEIGWTIYRRHWQQGFATEAAKAALAFGLETHQRTQAIAHISRGNPASIAVSRRLGMTYEADVDFYGEPIGRYALSIASERRKYHQQRNRRRRGRPRHARAHQWCTGSTIRRSRGDGCPPHTPRIVIFAACGLASHLLGGLRDLPTKMSRTLRSPPSGPLDGLRGGAG
ncbi:MAG: hypothetical protein JWO86_658 [Myxococcaceae bacterium]|nr:hypothetical protein [Myxococcaceae bacterium]